MNSFQLHCGDWKKALAHVDAVDAVICDPPYSARTHDGQIKDLRDKIPYESIEQWQCVDFLEHWAPRNRGWFVIFGDHTTWKWWEQACETYGLCVFPPVVWAKEGASPRMAGDGPASSCEYICVARPRRQEFMTWGSLPGYYTCPINRGGDFIGTKPINLMRALVRDYTRKNDLVVDPFAGSGTTLLACAMEGRRSEGSEINPDRYAQTQMRLARGYTPDLFAGAIERIA